MGSTYCYASDAELQVVIDSASRKVLKMEPVSIELDIVNNSKENQKIMSIGYSLYSQRSIRFFVKHPQDQNFKRIKYPAIYTGGLKIMSSLRAALITVIAPGEVINYNIKLHYDFPSISRRKWIFEKTGNYKIKVVIYKVNNQETDNLLLSDVNRTEIFSNELEISVSDPVEKQAKLALADFMKIKNEYLLYQDKNNLHMGSLEKNTEIYTVVQEFLKKYPDSYLSERIKSYADFEDEETVKRARAREYLKIFKENSEKERKLKEIKKLESYNQMTEQQKKDLSIAKAELDRITKIQKIRYDDAKKIKKIKESAEVRGLNKTNDLSDQKDKPLQEVNNKQVVISIGIAIVILILIGFIVVRRSKK